MYFLYTMLIASACLFASDNINNKNKQKTYKEYAPQGKLPSDFSFKKPEEYTEDVLQKRSSFMKQWREYQLAKENENK